MVAGLPVLIGGENPGARGLLDSEKMIWIIVVTLSISVPCLVAIVIYMVRRRRQRRAAQRASESVTSLNQWLQDVRYSNRSESNLTAHAVTNSPTHIFPHCPTHRSMSTPNLPVPYAAPQRSKSPLQEECQKQPGWSPLDDTLGLPPPRAIHPATRNDWTQ